MRAAQRTAPVVVLSGGAMRRFLVEAVPLFDRAGGIDAAIRFGPTRTLMQEIEDGAEFDVVLLPRWAIDRLAGDGRLAPGTIRDAVRSTIGVMVRSGAPVPDIGTVAAFKQALLDATAISYSKGPSGEHIAELLGRLGLAADLRDRTVFAVGRPVAEVIAGGEADIGMQQVIEVTPVAGAHLVGPLPGELKGYVVYSAACAPRAADSEAARAFVSFLGTAEAVQIIRGKGMEPG